MELSRGSQEARRGSESERGEEKIREGAGAIKVIGRQQNSRTIRSSHCLSDLPLRTKELCVRRYLTAVNGVENTVLALEGRELLAPRNAWSPGQALLCGGCEERTVEARVAQRRQRGLHGGRVESFDFGMRGTEGDVIERNELVTRLIVRESRLRQRQKRCNGAVKDRRRWRCHNRLAGLSQLVQEDVAHPAMHARGSAASRY